MSSNADESRKEAALAPDGTQPAGKRPTTFATRIAACKARWWSWVRCDAWERDYFKPPKEKSEGPILWLVGRSFAILRRMSLCEHIGHALYDKGKNSLKFVDSYLICWWVSLFLWTWYFGQSTVHSVAWALFWAICAVQVVQVNLHRNVWRSFVRRSHGLNKSTAERQPWSYCRNLFNAIFGYIEVNWSFGFVYWMLRESFDPQSKPESVVHSIYFSFVCGSTIGFGDIHPRKSEPDEWLLITIILHIVCNLAMIALVLGAGIAAVPKEDDQFAFPSNTVE